MTYAYVALPLNLCRWAANGPRWPPKNAKMIFSFPDTINYKKKHVDKNYEKHPTKLHKGVYYNVLCLLGGLNIYHGDLQAYSSDVGPMFYTSCAKSIHLGTCGDLVSSLGNKRGIHPQAKEPEIIDPAFSHCQ